MKDSNSLLIINKVEKPVVKVRGETLLVREAEELERGVKVLESVDITMHPRNQEDEVVYGKDGKVRGVGEGGKEEWVWEGWR